MDSAEHPGDCRKSGAGAVYLFWDSLCPAAAGASTQSTIVAVAPNGAALHIYSQSGDWYAVRFQNATGYAYAPYVTVTDETQKGV